MFTMLLEVKDNPVHFAKLACEKYVQQEIKAMWS